MRKLVLTLLVLVTAASFCAFADGSTPSVIFGYRINRKVPDSFDAVFVDYISKDVIQTKEIDLEKTLQDPVVALKVTTNKGSTYTLTLTFEPMKTNPDQGFNGLYKARVYDTDAEHDTVDFENGISSIEFHGGNSKSADIIKTFWYPISFQFSDYIDDYAIGDYIGTITLEVST